jgi:hypothetical protein
VGDCVASVSVEHFLQHFGCFIRARVFVDTAGALVDADLIRMGVTLQVRVVLGLVCVLLLLLTMCVRSHRVSV